VENSPAAEAGLRGGDAAVEIDGQQVQVGGDVIVAVDDASIAGFEDLLAVMRQSQPGQEVTLTLLRDGAEIALNVTLGERPVSLP
jgi:S1-C subfamily serine protease